MKIYQKIAFKLTAYFLAAVLAIFTFSLLITAYMFKTNLNSYLRQSPLNIAESVASELEKDLSSDATIGDISKKIKELSMEHGAEIIVYDQRGAPIVTSGIEKSTAEIPWCYGPMGMRNARTVTVPFYLNNRLAGFIGVVVNRETSIIGALARFQQSMFSSLLAIGILAVALSILAFYLVSKMIAKPIVEAAEVARRISDGDYNARVIKTENSEIGTLQETLNLLAEKLKKIEERRMELASDIAHEFKTPLSVLKANLEGIKDGLIQATPKHLDKLMEEIDRLSKLLEELKTIQMLDSMQLKPNLETVPLDGFIKDMVEIYRPLAESKGIDVQVDTDPVQVFADKNYLQRIFENIFINSVSYSKPGAKIVVRTSLKEKQGCFEIVDTGVGIKKEEIPFVFDRFYRAESSRSRRTGGSGLGLSIVKKLVESMNGKVEIESEFGKGTKVTVCLPAAFRV
ncbi:MAG: ATP-binding protein [Actinobacteria bacterium]|nr:ATP-binding protein [Actinomycetota bacterium]